MERPNIVKRAHKFLCRWRRTIINDFGDEGVGPGAWIAFAYRCGFMAGQEFQRKQMAIVEPKAMKVAICVDLMGSSHGTPEQEINIHKKHLQKALPDCDLKFYRAWHPGPGRKGIQANTDILLYDYGGMLPGCGGLLDSNARVIINWCQDNPGCLALIVSQFTYENQLGHELNEMGLGDGLPNLFVWLGEEQLPEWFTGEQ